MSVASDKMFLVRVVRAVLLRIVFDGYLRRKRYALQALKGREPDASIVDRVIDGSLGAARRVWPGKRTAADRRADGGNAVKWARFKKTVGTDGTFANFLFKSVAGFLGGIVMTVAIFTLLLLQLNYSYAKATAISSTVGSVLTLGLAFSPVCRCIFLMVLPQLFSDKGRHALLMYAFILSFSGPSKTTLHNTGILSESLTCLQDEIKSAIQRIVDVMKKPLLAVRSSITHVKAELVAMIDKMKKGMSAVRNTAIGLVRTIKSAYEWLHGVMNICNKKVGTPYQRCTKMFDDAVDECKVTVSATFRWMCSVSYVVSHVCYAVKFLDSVCEFFDVIDESVFGAIRDGLRGYVRHVENMFHVSVELKHTFSFDSTPSKLSSDIIRSVVTEIRYKIENVVLLFDWAGSIFSFLFLYVFVRVLKYRKKYLTIESFDNKYLTQELYDLDGRKRALGRPTVLPLTRVEKNKFVQRTSMRLLPKERRALFRSLAILVLATFKICIQMAVDYSLYWILNAVRKYGRMSSQLDPPEAIDVNIDGDGMLADLYRSIIHTFKPVASQTTVDTTGCLPNPLPPNYDCYRRITVVLTMTWFLAVMQPYGLRFRSYVMGYYHPDVARTRAAWLHNRVVRRRINYVTFARRFLRRKFGLGGGDDVADAPCLDFIYAKCPLLDRVWSREKRTACLLCGRETANGTDARSGRTRRCASDGCRGAYCPECFADVGSRCTLCSSPLDYGDITDVSEEKDSTDEAPRKVGRTGRRPARRAGKLRGKNGKNGKNGKRTVDSGEDGDDESSAGGSVCTTCSSDDASDAYENDPGYVNAPLNYGPLIVEDRRDGVARPLVSWPVSPVRPVSSTRPDNGRWQPPYASENDR